MINVFKDSGRGFQTKAIISIDDKEANKKTKKVWSRKMGKN